MQQFEKDQESTELQREALEQSEASRKEQLKKSHRRGMIKGAVLMLVICIVVVAVGGNLLIKQMTQTKVPVAITENDEQYTAVMTFESLLGFQEIQKINDLAAMIQAYYYEDVDRDALLEGMYAGLFDALDVYSEYFTKEEYDELYNMEISGNYCGIGATLSQNADTMIVEVVNVQADSPADRAGIKKGDLILQADEYDAMSMSLDEFVTHLRGEEGTSVTVEVYRESTEEYLTFDIVREALDIQSVAYDMLEGNVGYILISQFIGTTSGQVEAALADLQARGMTSLILDVRSNPGGLLSSVTEILDMILPEGVLVYTEDKYGNREDYMATSEESLDLPLVVLVNGNSASASEILAGAIKDYAAGTLVGTTTFGKGIVQGLSLMNDGSGYKITTSSYYTPNGICIHGTGIEPDVELEYEFLGSEESEYAYEYDNQIQKALEILQ